MKTRTSLLLAALVATLALLLPAAHAAPGGLDSTFGTGGIVTTPIGSGDEYGFSVAVQSDGKIVVAGQSHNGANLDIALVRYTAAGALDTSFGGGTGKVTTPIGSGADVGNSVVVQSDGKIVVAGYSENGSNNEFGLVRYTATGALDTSFGGGTGKVITPIGSGSDVGNSVVVQSDGKIVVAGYSHNGSDNDFALVRYLGDGSLDTSFGTGGKVTTPIGSSNEYGNSVLVQSDGKIVVAGYSSNGTNHDFALVRYTATGALDTSFGTGGKVTTPIGSLGDRGRSVAIQSDGKIVVAGYSENGSNNDCALVRYTATGALDTSFGGGTGKVITPIGTGNDAGISVAVQSDGKIIMAGNASNGSNADIALVRYTTTGALDTSFGGGTGKVTTPIGGGDDEGRSVAVQSDGKIVVAGWSNNGSNFDFALARYLVTAAPTQLTTNAATDSLPHWHPTNNKIGYGRYNGSSWDIATVNTDGTGETLIGTGLVLNGYHNAIGWVGSTNTMMAAETVVLHELLAFDTTQAPASRTTSDGDQGTVFTRKLLVPGGRNSNVMIVSRDGTRMVWRDQPNGGSPTQIRTALYSGLSGQNTDTHGTLVLSSANSGTGTRGMALTANGDTLVISVVTGSNFELWRYPTSGGAGTQLTTDASATVFNINPSISPDGTKILWQRGVVSGDSDIWMMNLDGTGKVNLTATASFSEGAPTWAPDGVQYAFAAGDGNLYKTTVPVAEQPAGGTVTIDFNDLPLGLQAPDFLAGYGIPSVTYGGTGPGAGGPTIYDNTGSNHVIPSPPKLLAQGGTSNDPHLTHYLRFNFTPELSAFSLKRTGKNGGGSTDTWRAYFYNAAGTLLGDFGEASPIINAPVTTFSFTAPPGQTIARMDLVSIWTNFATNRNIPVDDFTLTRATAPTDTVTDAPTLTSPATGTTTSSPISVSFSLPETALAGSVKLAFGTHILTLAASQETSGMHVFTFDPANPTAAPQIASISGGSTIPDGSYSVVLSYQDSLGNPAASATSTGVVIDTTTLTPTLTAPVASAIITTSTLTVSYTLPEAAFPGSVRLVFTGAADRTVVLTTTAQHMGTHVVSFSRVNPLASPDVASITGGSDIPDGYPYQLSLKYNDALNNSEASDGADFIRIDSTAPVVSVPVNITVPATGPAGAVVSFPVSAIDNVDGNLPAIAMPPSGSTFPVGTTTVNVTATDIAGNVGSNSFTVTVEDTAPPVISGVPANIVAEATGPAGRVVTFTNPTATDIVDGPVPVVCVPPSGSTFPIGTTTVTCTASDTRMNTSSVSFTVTVQDTTGPIFTTVPPPQSDMASAATGTAPVPDIVSLAAATDAVGVVSITQSPVAGTELPPGLHNIRLTARDAEDNEGIADVPFTVHVAPEAVNDVGFASKAVIFIDVLANDSLPAGSIITSVSPPSIGQARIENGMVRYTPPGTGLINSATFTYTAGVEPDLDTATVTVRPMADAVGTFVGLLQRTDSTVRGRVILTVASTGGMTGSVRFEGRTFPARAAVNGTTLALTGTEPKPVPAVLDRGAPDGIGQPTFIVTVPDSVPGQTLTATVERSPYKTANPAPQAGRYTIIADLPAGGTGPETAAALSCVVANDGKVTFGGKFSTAIAVTQAGKVLHGGRLPFFVSKGTGATMQGLGGELVFAPSGSPDVTGTLRWNVPAGTARLASGVAQDYDAIGQLYVPPALASGMFSPAVPTATLTLTAPSLGASSPLVRVLSLTNPPVNGLRNISFPGGFINLRVNTGLFTGTCTLSGSRTYFGAVLQGSPINAGQGTLLDTTSLQPVTFVP